MFDAVTDGADADTDLSSAAAKAEPRNFLRHVLSLSASKIAVGLIDPKLVLSWLLTHLGAGAFWIGLLEPVREAGALFAASDDPTDQAVRDPQVVLGQRGLGAMANGRPYDRARYTAL